MTHASVFSGIGGPEVAAAMLGWQNLFHCEINPFGRAVLNYWFPDAKSYEDITKTDFREWRGRVDVLTGGFPCQPFSLSGQRRGADDDRYLWPHMFRCIDEIRPTWVVAENVAGILSMVEQGEVTHMADTLSLFNENGDVRRYKYQGTFTIERICGDLETHGYDVQPVLIPACSVGAPHRRDRVFIVGRRNESDASYTESLGQFDGDRQGGGTVSERRNMAKTEWSVDETFVNGEQESSSYADNPGPESLRQGRQNAIHRSACASNADGGRGSKVEQYMGTEPADAANSLVNGKEQTLAYTDGRIPGWLRVASESGGAQIRYVIFGNGCRLRCTPDEIGSRWTDFPSQPPIHRGNDGIPFSMDSLTFSSAADGDGNPEKYSFTKWCAESIKAYGNAIVPQVMYEIMRAIEQVETSR